MTILSFNQVSLRFANQEKAILENINYTVKQGDFIILLGSNGSGKSSLLKLAHRHYQADTGHVHFRNQPISQLHTKAFSRQVAVLTQDCSQSLFTSLTVVENFQLMKPKKSLATNEKQFADYIADFNPNLAKKLHIQVDQLSGGEKQALVLALCLLQPPTLLLLDEHTSALDPKTSEQIMQLTQAMMARYSMTCILTTHDLDIALRYGNRILMLQDGKMTYTYDDQAKYRLSKEALMKHYY